MTEEQIQHIARRLSVSLGYSVAHLADRISAAVPDMPEDPELRQTLQDAAKALQDARARIAELEGRQ
ncbi:MAG: hypothetical protein EBR82_37905 [Caulobacteraceae bacterium]|nr:hypothetical protein [Caulobacteraceae bacterium]